MEKGPKFKSPELQQVTNRTYQQYLEFFSLPEEELKGKTILDIGSGFADFVKTANERFAKDGTKAIGVDPIYSFFDDDFDKFEKSYIRDANLMLEFSYGKKPQDREEFYKDFYQEVKNAGTHLAGSHQALPFKNESVDLVLGSNSIICLDDKEVVKRALEESLRVLRKDGEIRLQPVGIRWKEGEELYLGKIHYTTQEDAEEHMSTGRIPDKELFNILKELEAQGIKFYSFGTKGPEDEVQRGWAHKFYFENIILRKDDEIPQVNEGAEDFQELRKLSFLGSEDDYHISSGAVESKTT